MQKILEVHRCGDVRLFTKYKNCITLQETFKQIQIFEYGHK